MRRVRCPQCHSVVSVPDGQEPACHVCGFGGGHAAQGHEAAPAATGSGSGLSGTALAAIIVAGILVLAGIGFAIAWFATDGFSDRISEDKALSRLDATAVALLGDLAKGEAGDMDPSSLVVTFADPDGMTFTYGTNNLTRARLVVGSTTLTGICGGTEDLLGFGSTYYNDTGDLNLCKDPLATYPACIGTLDVTALPVPSLDRHGNGSVSATYSAGATNLTVELDKDGVLRSILIKNGTCTLDIRPIYGTRGTVTAPTISDPLNATLDAMLTEASEGADGDLKSFMMAFTGDDPDFGDDAEFRLGLQWGPGTTLHLRLHQDNATDDPVDIDLYCGGSREVMVDGSDVYEAKSGMLLCAFADGFLSDIAPGGDDSEDDSDLCDVPDDDTVVPTTVVHANGTVHVSLVEGTASLHVWIDGQGRATSIEFRSTDCVMQMKADYGTRTTIAIPATTDRLTRDLTTTEAMVDGNFTVEFTGTGIEDVPRADIQVRVLNATGVRVANFTLDDDSLLDNGFNFTWLGDSDSLVEIGDGFQINHTDWDSVADYEIVFWDLWADAEVGSLTQADILGIPGPSLAWIALAFVGLVVLVRRRE